MKQTKRGRPPTSHNIMVTPEFRDNPDVKKLVRAFVSIALHIAEQKKAEEQDKKESDSTRGNTKIAVITDKEDDMD